MKETTKTILIVILLLLLPVAAAGIGYYIYKKNHDGTAADEEDEDGDDSPASTIGGGALSVSHNSNENFPLYENSSVKSNLVKEIQGLLNSKLATQQAPYLPTYNGKQITSLKEDGYYGPKTSAVVKFFYGGDGKTITQEIYNKLTNPLSGYLF